MINRILAIAALLLFGFFASAAQGATAISYSEADNTYGWCAGYSTSEAPGCAKQYCEQSNGQDCKLALVCDAGWNAVAFADSDEAVGFGASCDMGSAYNARLAALASCIAKSRTLCWTSTTFSGGGDERSASDNGEFDLTWYVQGLLKGLGYDPGSTDGAFGNRTRTAIRSFQSDMGLDQTGEVSEELVYILLGKNGGLPHLLTAMDDLVAGFTSDEKSRIYSAAYTPLQTPTLSDELSFRTTAVQRVLLADYLRFNDRTCPIPATGAERTDPANGVWVVTCSNGGSYTIALSADGTGDTIADNNAPPQQQPDTQTAQNDTAPAETSTASSGISFSHSAPDDGWWVCTGSVATATDCAQTSCETDAKGTACETVLSCDDRGWSAAATSSNELRGMGFACGYAKALGARETALAECLAKTRSICSLVVTVDPDGSATTDEEDAEFTRLYHTQAMLASLGLYNQTLSGENDDTMQAAVETLQSELGLRQTGDVDDDFYELAYYANLGAARYVAIMTRDIYDKMNPDAAPNHYGISSRPADEVLYADELAGLTEDGRLVATAASIAAIDGGECTIPAISAERDGDEWIVDCAEGKFALSFTGYDMAVTPVASTAPDVTPEPPTKGPGKTKGAPTTPTTTTSTGKTKG